MADTKPVSFRVSEEIAKLIDELRGKSGMEPGAWFVSVIQNLAEQDILSDTVRISPTLAKAFESDVDRLNNALDVVKQTYINQMAGLNTLLDKAEQRHQRIVEELTTKHQEQLHAEVKKTEVLESQIKTEREARQLAEQMAKEEGHEKELLRKDYASLSLQLESLNNVLKERDERITNLTQEVATWSVECTKLQSLREDNEAYREQVSVLKDTVHNLENQLAALNGELARVRTQAQLDIATAVARKEVEAQERVVERFEDYQNRINACHDKLEVQREENVRLRNELAAQAAKHDSSDLEATAKPD